MGGACVAHAPIIVSPPKSTVASPPERKLSPGTLMSNFSRRECPHMRWVEQHRTPLYQGPTVGPHARGPVPTLSGDKEWCCDNYNAAGWTPNPGNVSVGCHQILILQRQVRSDSSNSSSMKTTKRTFKSYLARLPVRVGFRDRRTLLTGENEERVPENSERSFLNKSGWISSDQSKQNVPKTIPDCQVRRWRAQSKPTVRVGVEIMRYSNVFLLNFRWLWRRCPVFSRWLQILCNKYGA